jgi:CheY-like chemotaxis protein
MDRFAEIREHHVLMEPRSVLLVSADDATCRRTTVALQKAGYDVRRAPDADRAAMILLGAELAAVVLDRKLPDGGARVLERLAANADLFWLPVVLIGDDAGVASGTWASQRRPTRATPILRALQPVGPACVV